MRRYKPASGSVPPLTRKGEATRQRIVDAAITEIGNQGFHLASVNSSTNRAGVGQGTFYLYFKSKDDLLTELVTKLSRELRDLFHTASQNTASRLAAEHASITAFLKYVFENKALYRLFMEAQFINEALYQSCYQSFADHWIELLDIAGVQGQLLDGNNEIRAWAIMGMHHMLASKYALWQETEPNEEVVEQAIALLRDGISPQSANM